MGGQVPDHPLGMSGLNGVAELREQFENDAASIAELTEKVVASAEELLSRRYGGMQSLQDVQRLNGSGVALVLRARVAPSPFLQQRSVIIKYTPPTGADFDESGLLREIVAYQFTTSLSEDVRPGPILLAHDMDEHLLVITDSGDGDTFAELLRTHNPQMRQEILRNLGEAIGRMHAGTAMKEPHFEILMHRMAAKYPEIAKTMHFRERLLRASILLGMELVEHSGIAVQETVRDFAMDANRRLSSGHHRAFTPFDLSPDNIIVSSTTHFLDYEWAGFRDAAFDLACVVAGFPQFLFTEPISDDEADVFIEAWTHQVSRLWPNVNNLNRLHARVLTALVGWSFASIALMHFSTDAEAFEKLYTLVLQNDAAPLDVSQLLTLVGHSTPLLATKEMLNLPTGVDEDTIKLARKDLSETFEALARFAARNSDSRFPEVQVFAQTVVERLV
ncbi:phosphotransferase [Corynebacterium kozikiae]|uniref:phosphotransferase n=1 Tax=Corynebacterium kozikiae TaxID=2968469 RepID=UPI00211CFE4F|nr:phosphotransferase [Corynebacterium sp. 76QC2CO]MCQ9342768.1 phosphotransferase [Corynebacterium sp. 76QC2CO]